jgi:hypothetical protein
VELTRGQYYHARFDGSGVTPNHLMVTGGRWYVAISFNHRLAYLDAADVTAA